MKKMLVFVLVMLLIGCNTPAATETPATQAPAPTVDTVATEVADALVVPPPTAAPTQVPTETSVPTETVELPLPTATQQPWFPIILLNGELYQNPCREDYAIMLVAPLSGVARPYCIAPVFPSDFAVRLTLADIDKAKFEGDPETLSGKGYYLLPSYAGTHIQAKGWFDDLGKISVVDAFGVVLWYFEGTYTTFTDQITIPLVGGAKFLVWEFYDTGGNAGFDLILTFGDAVTTP